MRSPLFLCPPAFVLLLVLGVITQSSQRIVVNWEAPSDVRKLDLQTFEETIKSGKWFIMFYSPHCSNSKVMYSAMVPAGAVNTARQTGVRFGRFDCLASYAAGEFCDSMKVEGYPTVFPFFDGKKLSEYVGSRSVRAISNFVQSFQLLE